MRYPLVANTFEILNFEADSLIRCVQLLGAFTSVPDRFER